MDLNRFTTKSAEAIQAAMQAAEKMKHQAVEPLHITKLSPGGLDQ